MPKEPANIQKGTFPEPVDYSGRTKEHATLFENVVWDGTYRGVYSKTVDSHGYRNFTLFLHVTSNLLGVHRLDIMPQFSDYDQGDWCDYAQGLFAALGYSDAVAAVNIHQCFSGACAGRFFKVRVTGTGVAVATAFTATARVEFWS